MQACARPRDARMLRGWRDAETLSTTRRRDAKLNELPLRLLLLSAAPPMTFLATLANTKIGASNKLLSRDPK